MPKDRLRIEQALVQRLCVLPDSSTCVYMTQGTERLFLKPERNEANAGNLGDHERSLLGLETAVECRTV